MTKLKGSEFNLYICPLCRWRYSTPAPVRVTNKDSNFYNRKLCAGCALHENRKRSKAETRTVTR